MKELKIVKRNGEEFIILIDDRHYDEVVKWNWCIGTKGYARRGYTEPNYSSKDPAIKRKAIQGNIQLHQFLWFLEYGEVIDGSARCNKLTLDHINRNRLDNRLCNLRKATAREQEANKEPGTYKNNGLNKSTTARKTGLRGAYKVNNGWVALITYKNKKRHLGTFNTKLEAHEAFCAAYLKLRGVAAPV